MKHTCIMLLLLALSATATEAETLSKDDIGVNDSILLNEIQVTGVTGAQRLKDAAQPFTVIKAEDLHQRGATNIIEAISSQPGIAQVTTGSSISKPVIRGLGYNRVVVVADGIRQEEQQWGDEHGVQIDGNNIWQVEVLKGPATLRYGSDAMAGVVIMHPQPLMTDNEIKASVGTEYHTNNGLWNSTVNLRGNQGMFVWDLRYSDKRAHAYKNRYDGYVPGTQFAEQAISTMLGLRRTHGHNLLRFSYLHFKPSIAEGERDATTGELEWPEGISKKTYSETVPYQKVNHLKIVSDNKQKIGIGDVRLLVGYQQNYRKEFEEMDEAGLKLRLHTINYDAGYNITDIENWTCIGGVSGMWQQSKNEGDEYLVPDYRLFDIGAYLAATHRMGAFNINAGMRFDHRHLGTTELEEDGSLRFNEMHRNFSAFSGTLGAVWNITDRLDLRFNVSKGFRAPNVNELTSNGVHEGSARYEIGDNNLKAEHSLQFDLGLDYTNELLSLQVALFANSIDNYIYLRKLPGIITEGKETYQYQQGDAQLFGAEVSVDIHPVEQLHILNTFGIVDARQKHVSSEEKYLPRTPEPRWNLDVRYTLPKGFHIRGNMEQHFRQNHYYAAYDTETATPAYTLINLGAGWTWKQKDTERLRIDIMANNLFDCTYQNHLSRLKYTDFNNVTGRQGIYAMGRDIMMKVTIPINIR